MSALDLRKAILVDDDRDIAVQAERVLRRCGVVEIQHCRRMATAGARISGGDSVDFILVDVELDEARGRNVGELLSGGAQSFSHIPVLFIAAPTNRADVAALREAGCFHFLMKPLNDNILEQKIRELAFRSFEPEKEREVVGEIRSAITSGNLMEAEKLLKPVLRRYPAAPSFQVLLAELFYAKEDFHGANSVVSKTLKIDPDYLPAMQIQERIHERLEIIESANREKAQAELRVAQHNEALNINARAMVLVKDGQFDEAMALYGEALALSEGFEKRHTILFNLAMACFRAGKYHEAKERCIESTSCAPDGYDKPGLLLQKISDAEAQVAAQEAERVSAQESAQAAEAEAALAASESSSGSDPEEEARILRFIMFEGKY